MKRNVTSPFVWIIALGTSIAAAEKPVPVGLQKQLFVDDYVVAEKQNVTRELGTVKKCGVVLEPTLPTDFIPPRGKRGNGYYERALGSGKKPDGSRVALDFGYYLTVLRNKAGTFQMWYMAWRLAGVGYAESKDGITWTKPLVGKGGKDNIVHLSQGFSCSIDPTVPWGHRAKYKAAFDSNLDRPCQPVLAYSSDGIRWTHYNAGRPVSHRAADTHNQILWDPIARHYRLLTRTDLGAGGGAKEWRSTRVMAHSKGNDLEKHPAAWKILADRIRVDDPRKETNRWGQPHLQFNGMTCWIHEGVYFGLMDVYTMDRKEMFSGFEYRTRHEKDIMDFYIGVSRDGLRFDKSWIHARKPLVPRGPAGAFDKDGVKPPSQILTVGDEHWIYYAGMSERHYSIGRDLKIGLARLRLDGLVYLTAGKAPGTIVTRPFKLEGSRLLVNVDAAKGRLLVEILDAAGRPLPGFSGSDARACQGVDDLRLAPQWKAGPDLSALTGKVVRLKFHLRNAKLYSFRVASATGQR